MGVSTPERVHNEHVTQRTNHKSQPLSPSPLWSAHNWTLYRHLKPSYKQNPDFWEERLRKNCSTQTPQNNNSPTVQLTTHVTHSREHRGNGTDGTAQAWDRTLGCSLPQLFQQIPNSDGTKHHYDRNKGPLEAAFFNSMNPLLHTKFMPRCLETQYCPIML